MSTHTHTHTHTHALPKTGSLQAKKTASYDEPTFRLWGSGLFISERENSLERDGHEKEGWRGTVQTEHEPPKSSTTFPAGYPEGSLLIRGGERGSVARENTGHPVNSNFSKQIIVQVCPKHSMGHIYTKNWLSESKFNWVFYISFTKSSKPTKSQRTITSESHPAQQVRGHPRTQKY